MGTGKSFHWDALDIYNHFIETFRVSVIPVAGCWIQFSFCDFSQQFVITPCGKSWTLGFCWFCPSLKALHYSIACLRKYSYLKLATSLEFSLPKGKKKKALCTTWFDFWDKLNSYQAVPMEGGLCKRNFKPRKENQKSTQNRRGDLRQDSQN